MRVANYPYGKITKTLRNAITRLNANKKKIGKEQFDYFEYPDYWDMPKMISSRLSSDDVDWIQDETYNWYHDASVCNCKTVEEVRTIIVKHKACELEDSQ